ncbi:CopM family metallochaperone [Phreatobacter sp.]|uniref:CopM family metallochaperone n=1 Tax=Phreatobacter sp. TaxID=1966341 RepID=UPI003F6FAC04
MFASRVSLAAACLAATCLAGAPAPALSHHHDQGVGPRVAQASPGHGAHGNHGRHTGQAAPVAGRESPAVAAFRAANARMHRDMDIAFTGHADADFVRGMIPHHQGAIDMARVVLEHGRDEQVRKWAADIIREQEREIAEMRDWLRRNGH